MRAAAPRIHPAPPSWGTARSSHFQLHEDRHRSCRHSEGSTEGMLMRQAASTPRLCRSPSIYSTKLANCVLLYKFQLKYCCGLASVAHSAAARSFPVKLFKSRFFVRCSAPVPGTDEAVQNEAGFVQKGSRFHFGFSAAESTPLSRYSWLERRGQNTLSCIIKTKIMPLIRIKLSFFHCERGKLNTDGLFEAGHERG